nr:Chain C, 10-mer peptide from Protein Nef [Human immunodeficiency virus 1]3VXO_C Chain C, 10-mer peptide from Protein Nef [Human immunodeficiency virus 1]3VXO_F Chain F, 10-mer peptide from Protein Nef [Human immunodeficiency virus 1]3VXU_C Chain C, 10-mer peptide from Protein Nef [Human immunodeficiency virus 1]3VXU_H Chain H, 10-mer peptide from Protein Nef [Human immunodeficiency virus 1]3W0W_C Chain C, 10-mer peptide from Protein Nef [Human immunodeficiency virus 1]5HGD_C Chain C, Prote
RFPLTFGWCF